MEYEKQGSSDTSSEENDQQHEIKSKRRSYECTFCKRGFTNAQALGGHMNIHRKDRAKTKQHSGSSPSERPDHYCDQYMPSSYFVPISALEPATNFYPDFEAQRNYHMYYQPPTAASGHRFSHGYHESEMFVHSFMSEDLLGGNLSLQSDSSNLEDGGKKKENQEDELDLELRLGHDP